MEAVSCVLSVICIGLSPDQGYSFLPRMKKRGCPGLSWEASPLSGCRRITLWAYVNPRLRGLSLSLKKLGAVVPCTDELFGVRGRLGRKISLKYREKVSFLWYRQGNLQGNRGRRASWRFECSGHYHDRQRGRSVRRYGVCIEHPEDVCEVACQLHW